MIRQGDAADSVLQVLDGSVEILREAGELVIVLGSLVGEWASVKQLLPGDARFWVGQGSAPSRQATRQTHSWQHSFRIG